MYRCSWRLLLIGEYFVIPCSSQFMNLSLRMNKHLRYIALINSAIHHSLCWYFQAFWTIQFSLLTVPYLIGYLTKLKWTWWFFKKIHWTDQRKKWNRGSRYGHTLTSFKGTFLWLGGGMGWAKRGWAYTAMKTYPCIQVVSRCDLIICIVRVRAIKRDYLSKKSEFERCSGAELNSMGPLF